MVFYSRTYRYVLRWNMRRYSSGQRGQTVNLLASAYGGSNPPRRTFAKNIPVRGIFVAKLRRGGFETHGMSSKRLSILFWKKISYNLNWTCNVRRPCQLFCDVRRQNNDNLYWSCVAFQLRTCSGTLYTRFLSRLAFRHGIMRRREAIILN